MTTRITTPLNDFLAQLSDWLTLPWFVWVGLALVVAAIVAVVLFAKARARAQARVPHYKRSSEQRRVRSSASR